MMTERKYTNSVIGLYSPNAFIDPSPLPPSDPVFLHGARGVFIRYSVRFSVRVRSVRDRKRAVRATEKSVRVFRKKTRAPPQKRHVFKRLSVAPILAKYDKPKKETAGFLTYDAAYRAAKGTRAEKRFPRGMPEFVKHSNGGCSGFEPDSLLSKNAQIYSAYNFSNRISSHGIKLNIL